MIWSVQRLGKFDEEEMKFSSVRLTRHKQRQAVLQLEQSAEPVMEAVRRRWVAGR